MRIDVELHTNCIEMTSEFADNKIWTTGFVYNKMESVR